MSLMNKRDVYGTLTIFLHWLLFLLIVGSLASGKFSASLGQEDKIIQVIVTHKYIGLTVFTLMFCRLLWRWINVSVESLSNSSLVRTSAFLVHMLLYLAILAQALGGIAMSQSFGNDIVVMNLTVPLLFGDGGLLGGLPFDAASPRALGIMLREWHGIGGNVLIGLIGLHILGALFHHFVQTDDTLRRMWFRYIPPYLKDKYTGL